MPEYPAILRWMVDGCLEWQRAGLGVPDRVRKASDDDSAHQDTLELWIEDCLDTRPNPMAFTLTRLLFGSWKAWADVRNTPPGSERAFAENSRKRLPAASNGRRGFKGITLKTPERERNMTLPDGPLVLAHMARAHTRTRDDGDNGENCSGSVMPGCHPTAATQRRNHKTSSGGRPRADGYVSDAAASASHERPHGPTDGLYCLSASTDRRGRKINSPAGGPHGNPT